ncbi:uncharacterized protein LOC118508837 [Anopheles stephensi]|uniref:uncharacterized protein LOC118508837 n=1 Tax=Anopheles stephensi TaxID=30069 RepID=UPI0016589FA1|nr:uncharacterized protein LOC118508837 [Anopheles stephensi]
MESKVTQRVSYRCAIRPRPVDRYWWHTVGAVMLLSLGTITLFGIGDVDAATVLCPLAETVDISNGTQDADGTIEHEGVRYGTKHYFRDSDDGVRGCVCLVKQCFHVYCSGGTPEGQPCFDDLNVNFSMSSDGMGHGIRNLRDDPNYHFFYFLPHCSRDFLILTADEYILRSDGILMYGDSTYNYRHYGFEPSKPYALAGYCEMVDVLAMHRMYSIGILISLPFLVATFVVYAILPEMQNIPGKSLMCYVAALTVSYLLVALMRFGMYGYRTNWCVASGYLVYTALLASFFWLNVMAFDIFWTFGGSRGRSSERRKFLYYCLYAWGVPLLLVGFVTLVDNTDFIHESMRPQIGQERCFVSEDMLIGFLYMYLPLLLLVSANVVFFAVTAIRIYRMEQATASALSGDSRRHTKYEKDRNRYSLYLRLFVIMGVTWTVEIITWLVGESSWLIYLVDICNCLTGISIFILFVWKPKVKQLLLKRFGIKRGAPGRNDQNTNSTVTTTRSTDLKGTANPAETRLTDMTHGNCIYDSIRFDTQSWVVKQLVTIPKHWHRLYRWCYELSVDRIVLHSVFFATQILLLSVAGSDREPSINCPLSERIDLTEGVPDSQGSVRFAGNIYSPENYTTSGENHRYSCVCAQRKCVYVCCYHIDRSKCEESSLPVNRTSSSNGWMASVLEEVDLRESREFWLIYATPPAWSSMPGYALQISGHEGELFNDGSFAYGTKVYASRTYCINPAEDSMPYVWIKETDEHLEVHRWHSLGMIISIPFLVATLIVYALIPDLRNIPGKSLMCYVFALAVSYMALILIKRSVFDNSPDWCTVVGYVYYFSVMSSLFWLNVMAFDIFWTFGGRTRRTTDQGKFLLYCCYGFGCPLVFLALALVADHTELMYTSLRPKFGDGQCLFKGEQFVAFLYLYLPLILLVSANLFFFIRTAIKINKIERTTAAALQGESGRHSKYTNERNRYGLYVRLFVVMGVTWTFEFITWIADSQHWMALVTDVCNCISGVFIFFLFVWKRKVWKLLQQRLSGKQVQMRNQPLFSVSGTRTTSLPPVRKHSTMNMEVSSF